MRLNYRRRKLLKPKRFTFAGKSLEWHRADCRDRPTYYEMPMEERFICGHTRLLDEAEYAEVVEKKPTGTTLTELVHSPTSAVHQLLLFAQAYLETSTPCQNQECQRNFTVPSGAQPYVKYGKDEWSLRAEEHRATLRQSLDLVASAHGKIKRMPPLLLQTLVEARLPEVTRLFHDLSRPTEGWLPFTPSMDPYLPDRSDSLLRKLGRIVHNNADRLEFHAIATKLRKVEDDVAGMAARLTDLADNLKKAKKDCVKAGFLRDWEVKAKLRKSDKVKCIIHKHMAAKERMKTLRKALRPREYKPKPAMPPTDHHEALATLPVEYREELANLPEGYIGQLATLPNEYNGELARLPKLTTSGFARKAPGNPNASPQRPYDPNINHDLSSYNDRSTPAREPAAATATSTSTSNNARGPAAGDISQYVPGGWAASPSPTYNPPRPSQLAGGSAGSSSPVPYYPTSPTAEEWREIEERLAREEEEERVERLEVEAAWAEMYTGMELRLVGEVEAFYGELRRSGLL